MKNGNMRTVSLCFLLMLNVKNSLSNEEELLKKEQIEGFRIDTIDHPIIQGSKWRTVEYEELNDPKKEFFSRMELPDDTAISAIEGKTDRNRRQTDDETIEKGTIIINTDIAKEMSTQQEEVNSEDTVIVSTENVPSTTEIVNHAETSFVPINDFLRFRRELIQKAHENPVEADNESKSKGKTQYFDMENENFDEQNNRGTRGLSTQEWVKFPYQVERTEKTEDSFATPSVFNKPRRVHFITRKQFSVDNPPISSLNSRQGRIDDQPRLPRDQSRERLEMDARRGKEIFSPRFRSFDGPLEYPNRFSRGRYYERDLIEQRPDFRSLGVYPRNRDRRIIYYANLPEITKNPPRFREMGRFKDPVEESYFGSKYQRGFYRDLTNKEHHNPMVVSADINVRDVMKNPEKRIYSDVKRKYYDSPYFDEDQSKRIQRN